MTGIGITTYNRPDYLKQCLESLLKNTTSWDYLVVYNDGSPEPAKSEYEKVKEEIHNLTGTDIVWIYPNENKGVATAKNTLLHSMLDAGCDDMFLLEDDILLLDDRAITEYIRIGKEYGFHHFMFAHHGNANAAGAVYSDPSVEYFSGCVGAWCYYTKSAIEELKAYEEQAGVVYPGFFDENFHNAWEHVEHTKRLGDLGVTGWWGLFVDIAGSKNYISEIKGSIENSSIRPNPKWRENQIKGLEYWEKKWGAKPDISLPEEVV